jgi:hypothetical protein
VEKPTQTLTIGKGLDNTVDISSKWAITLPSLIYFYEIFIEIPLHNLVLKYQIWYLIPCCGLEVHNSTQELTSVNGVGYTVDLISKWVRTLPSLIYFSWDIYRDPLHKNKFKYESWYWTPCCGLEVKKPTQAIKLVRGPGNTFNLNPLDNYVYNIRFDIWHPAVGLRCRIPPRHIRQLKAQAILLT